MNSTTNNQFPLPFNAYAAFDATSLKTLMQQRLSQGGVFTDQIYEGSNFNSLLDIIAYSYSVLLFYLNKTGSESLYSQAQLYENMNKIVKSLNYNPVGYQSSVLDFNASAPASLAPNIYTIPRYSYFTVNGINYSFTKDTSFTKFGNSEEILEQLMQSSLLYQGLFFEYPIYVANGTPFERFSLAAVSPENSNEIIDHTNIYVYVFDQTNKWVEWTRVESLYLQGPSSKTFECRFNENQRYEIKFGNNINGKQLTAGNRVAVYYLRSSGAAGEVGPGTLDGNRLFLYSSAQFNTIFNDVKSDNQNYLSQTQSSSLIFTNTNASTQFSSLENVESMRVNAANTFKTQYRLITTEDFELFVKNNYNNIINDVKVVNNWEYLSEHVRYLYNIGLKAPNDDSRVLFNQVTFADSCDFNNIYVYLVPKIQKITSAQINSNFLAVGLKDYILAGLQNIKMATAEVVLMDPVYIAAGLGVASNAEIGGQLLTPNIINETKLVIGRVPNSRFSETEIKRQITTIINDYFAPANVSLGQTLNLDDLTTKILSIEGVTEVSTRRTVEGQEIVRTGLSFLLFNPVYSEPGEDIAVVAQSYVFPYFKIPYLYNPETLLSQIQIITPSVQGASIREY